MKKILLTTVAALSLAFVPAQAQRHTPPTDISAISPTFRNPLRKGADPYVVKHDGKYYSVLNSRGGFVITESRFLTKYESREQVWIAPKGQDNSYNHWAPEVHPIGGKWYIYYAGSPHSGTPYDKQRTFVLESDTPLGQYEDKGVVYTGDDPEQLKDNLWAIDMTVLQHDGKNYAIWSGWDAIYPDRHNIGQQLYIAEMVNPWTLGKRVLLASPELDWEKGDNINLLEGPQILKHGEDVFVFYSTRGSWTVYYKMGCLKLKPGADPIDPASWAKSDKPVFQGNRKVFGVGHATLTTSPDDSEYWVYYHSKNNPQGGWENREVFLQKFNFDADGNPVFGEARGAGEMLRPSGEVEIERSDLMER